MRTKIITGAVVAVFAVGVGLFFTTQTNHPNQLSVDTLLDSESIVPEAASMNEMSTTNKSVALGEASDTNISMEPIMSSTEISNEAEITMNQVSEPPVAENQIREVPIAVVEKTALLANGCFWCAEADLEKLPGVREVVSGYAGGTTENPTYKNHAAAGHREVVLVTYDANQVSFAQLVEFTIKHGDPTDADGSFNDRGPQYAPAIYFETPEEEAEARRVIDYIDGLGVFAKPLPLAVLPRVTFWPAEDYHQDYAKKNPLKYSFYRTGSGRSSFIERTWGDGANTFVVPAQSTETFGSVVFNERSWDNYVKPSESVLRALLTPLQYKVTQEDGTETPFSNIYDKNYEAGIYVDIVSGEPLFLSTDKYDSKTGWPSFVKPISAEVITLHEDNTLFSKRTEVRSRYADSHLGHVFGDGPKDRGGLRYCMNSAALRFVAKADMEREGYGYLLTKLEE